LTVGSHTLVVTTSWGDSEPFSFTTIPRPAPVVASVTPDEGSTAHATSAQVTGQHFVDLVDVTVGGDSVPFTVTDESHLQIQVPAGEPGSAPVVVETDHGVSNATISFSRFEPPEITSVTRTDFDDGYEVIVVEGTGLDRVTQVLIDHRAVTFFDGSVLEILAPPHAPGSVPLTLVTPSDETSVILEYVDPHPTGPLPVHTDAITLARTYQPLAGDFTGDGVDDVFWYAPGPASDSLWRFEPDGRFTGSTQSVTGTYRPAVGDFTGDGVDDILWYAPGSGADSMWDYNPGGSRTVRSVSMGGSYTPLTGDFTGDGVDDVFWYAPGTATDFLWDYNTGGSRTSKSYAVTATYLNATGDFTGDGVDDILWYAPGTAADWIWDHNPDGSLTARKLAVNRTYTPIAGDFTGDDVDDIIWYAPTGSDVVWDHETDGSLTARPIAITGTYRAVAADLTGGGVTDLVLHGPGAAPDALWFMSPVIR
jgi:hypothetical protein